MTTEVYVAVYTHRHGEDIRVFASAEGIEGWRQDIAEEWWDDEIKNEPRPADAEAAADRYFEIMEGRDEYFSYVKCPVET